MSYFSAKREPRKKQVEALAPTLRAAAAVGTALEDLQRPKRKLAPQIRALCVAAQSSFDSWHYELRLGHSLLFLGYGSSRAILNQFGAETCTDGAVVAIKCTAQYLTLRTLLQKLILVQRASCSTTLRASGDIRDLVESIKQQSSLQRLYVILHGIDSPALRGPDVQATLAEIAALPGVHLLASVRHVSALSLWDRKASVRFRWLFHHLPAFEPRPLEAAKCRPLLQTTRAEGRKQGSAVVLYSLVARERKIFEVLAQHQLGAGDEGMTVTELFETCRSRFLVSTEHMLNHHLGELKDHKLVLTRSKVDDVDLLYIPMDEEAIVDILSALEGGTDTLVSQH